MNRTHDCPKHDPGSNACYTICRCRCYPCSNVATAYRAQIAHEQAQGISRRVDAEPVRRHVQALMAGKVGSTRGVGLKRIAEVSGVSNGSLWKLMYGNDGHKSSYVLRTTAERLLAVSHADMADGATVPAASTWKRLDELLGAGFVKSEVARLVHGPQARALQVSRDSVTVANARRVAAIHKLWRTGRLEPHGRCSRHHDHSPEEVHADVERLLA